MTLIESIITVAILTILGLISATMLNQLFQENRTVGMVSDYNELINELRSILADGPMCTAALAGQHLGNAPIQLAPPAPQYTTAHHLQAGDKFNSVTLTALNFEAPNPPLTCVPACPGRYAAFVHIETDFDHSTIGLTHKGISLPVYVDLDASNNVISCLGKSGDGPKQLCVNLGGTFLNGPPPVCTLPVELPVTFVTATATPGNIQSSSAPHQFGFCALTSRIGGGNVTGEGCTVLNFPVGSRNWRVQAINPSGGAPSVTCQMGCVP